MNLHNIMAMNYILALIKRDDGERILLGAGAYEFKEEQQHFAANIIANDVIEKQGTDGQLLAGQVRRSASQLFTGYVGDETISRLEAETYRRRFLQFFQTNHFYTVVYILADGRAIQRKTGYLTEAPSVPELYQQTPEYSVALAFQDVNYYTYNENEAGEEIFGRSYELDPEGVLKGGLAWDQIGAIWTDYVWRTTQLEPIATFNFKDLSQLRIRELLGRTQQSGTPTTTNPAAIESVTGSQITSAHGKNLFIPVVNTGGGFTRSYDPKTGEYKIEGIADGPWRWLTEKSPILLKAGEPYTFSRNTNTPFRLVVRCYNTDGTYSTDSFGFENLSSVTRVIVKDVVGIVLMAAEAGDVTCTLKIQIEAGDTATAFEPAWTQDQEIDLGKNLINPATIVNGIPNIDTGQIERETSAGRTTPFIRVQPGEIYTVKGQGTYGWTTVAYYTANKTFIGRLNNEDVTFTIPAGAYYMRKTCAEAALSTAQLEKGGTATTYSARRPLGRNLFDKNSAKILKAYVKEDGVIAGSVNVFTYYIPCEPNTTYTVQKKSAVASISRFCVFSTSAAPTIGMKVLNLAGSPTGVDTTPNYSITTAPGAKYLGIFTSTGATEAQQKEIINSIQVERGGTANAYERYFDRIELHQIGEYRDTLFKDQSTGKWYFNRQTDAVELTADDTSSAKSTWDSTVPRIYIAASTLGQIAEPIFPLTDDEPVAAYTDRFEAKSFADVYTNKKGGFASSPTARNWQFSSLDWTDQATARAELTGTVIRFARRIEETLEIADPTLIAQLNNTGGEFKGEVTAEIHSQDLAAYSTAESSDGRTGGALWTEGGERGSNTVNVEGIGKVQPTWTVYGPAASPYIENVTTNQRLEYIGEIEDGQKLVVDTRQQIATIDGHLVTGNIRGQWIELQRGDNIIRYGGDKVDEPSIIEWDEVIE